MRHLLSVVGNARKAKHVQAVGSLVAYIVGTGYAMCLISWDLLRICIVARALCLETASYTTVIYTSQISQISHQVAPQLVSGPVSHFAWLRNEFFKRHQFPWVLSIMTFWSVSYIHMYVLCYAFVWLCIIILFTSFSQKRRNTIDCKASTRYDDHFG